MQEENHIFQGLRRDNHQIKQTAEFLWDAHNIRLTSRDDSTLLSITNEKGPKQEDVNILGCYVGHCIVGKFLVVFTEAFDKYYIYRIEEKEDNFNTLLLFFKSGHWEKGWSQDYPIEAIGVYETELVQKVYWVDGKNQPRVINVTKPELKGLYDYNAYTDNLYLKESFDFVQTVNLTGKMEVEKHYTDGEFPSGVIQYVCTYYNKYSQESKIWYTTPLYYTSFKSRAGSGEDKVSNSFKVSIIKPDTNFEFVRVYSILRTSINAIPTVKRVIDLPINSGDNSEDLIISFIDTGTIGDIISPNELLYIGGTNLIAECITHKDNTLFLGNITLNEHEYQEQIKALLKPSIIENATIDTNTNILDSGSVYYSYTPNLSGPNVARFKTNEVYRLGIQGQYSDGSWTDPIFIKDDILVNKYPWEDPLGERSTKVIKIDDGTRFKLLEYGIQRLRTCVVFPSIFERDILFQGILCPTVYSVMGRKNGTSYANSSWFFRAPNGLKADSNITSKDDMLKIANIYKGASIQYRHNKALYSGNNPGAEIQNMLNDSKEPINSIMDINLENVRDYNSYFFVDENIVTLHSPD